MACVAKRLMRVVGAVSLGAGVVACALLGGPDLRDVKLSRVEIVDLKDRADVVWLSNDQRPSRTLVMVSFTTDVDLLNYVRRYEYNIGTVVSLCNEETIDRSQELQRDPYVYDSAGQIDAYRKDDSSGRGAQSTAGIYHLFLDARPIALAGRSDIFAYDLQLSPKDVCFQLRGGNMLGSKFVSNTAIVPKDMLVDAFSRADVR
jgi:hypothetical protein